LEVQKVFKISHSVSSMFFSNRQQYSGSLIAGGNSSTIRCWDLAYEKCTNTLDTDTEACVTTLCTAWDPDSGLISGPGIGPDIIMAGHSDGSLKVFDIRTSGVVSQPSGRRARKTRFTEHRNWIVDAAFTSYGGRSEIISGSVDGDIRAWDLRMSTSLRTLDVQRSPMTALAVHKKVPIAATGSHAQFIKILTLEGETLQVARYHEESPGLRIGPVSCLEFHKQKLVLAAGTTDSLVSIYKPKHPQKL
jgi:regulator-associated protein of mTOR